MKKIYLQLLITLVVIIVLVAGAIILFPNRKEGAPLKNANIIKDLYGFSGMIKAIKEKTLTLSASIPSAEENVSLIKADVKILIDEQTRIYGIKFPKTAPEKDKPIETTEIPLNFNDLSIGDTINVSFVENISDKIKAGEQLVAKDLFIIMK